MESTEIIREICQKMDYQEEENLVELGLIEPDSLEVELKLKQQTKLKEILLEPAPEFCDEYDSEESELPRKALVVPVIVLTEDTDSTIVESKTTTLSIQIPTFHLEESPPARSPKRMFRETSEQEPDTDLVSIKDLETKKLVELERERRRIIDNQVVRRKKIDYWAFASPSPVEFSEDQLLLMADENGGVEALAHQGEPKMSPKQTPPPTPPPPIPNQKENLIQIPMSLSPGQVSQELEKLLEESSVRIMEASSCRDSNHVQVIRVGEIENNVYAAPEAENDPEPNVLDLQNETLVENDPETNVLGIQNETEAENDPEPNVLDIENVPETNVLDLQKETEAKNVPEPNVPDLQVEKNVPEQNVEETNLEPKVPEFAIRVITLSESIEPQVAIEPFPDNFPSINPSVVSSSPLVPLMCDEEAQEQSEDNKQEENFVPEPIGIIDAHAASIGCLLTAIPYGKSPHAWARAHWTAQNNMENESSEASIINEIEPIEKPESVDCESILENKERLRVFWENRIMADQEVNETSISEPITAPDSATTEQPKVKAVVTEAPVPSTDEIFQPTAEELTIPEISEPDSLEDKKQEELSTPVVLSVDEGKPEDEFIVEDESALDLEVKEALNREEENKLQHSPMSQEDPEDFPVHHVALAPTVEESEEEEIVKTEDISLEDKPEVEPVTFEIDDKQILIENEAISDKAFSEDFIEIKDVLPNKPQIVGETLHQIQQTETEEIPEVKPNAITEFPKQVRTSFNPNSDTKIALEIKEMKEREEELKKMREAILKENQNNAKNQSSSVSEQGSVHSEEDQQDFKIQNNNNNQMPRAISLDSLPAGQNYNIGYAFGHRRKDGIKVKPLTEELDENTQNAFKIMVESPIEREIRLAKDREEELRRDKGMTNGTPSVKTQENGKQRPQTLEIQMNGKLPTSKTTPFQVPLKSASPNGTGGDTQRFLATSRIQQEIEEQTEREKALRASGKIQTISQERTDAKVAATRLRDMSGSIDSGIQTPASPSLSEGSDKSSSPLNGSLVKTPSPTNSTVSGVKSNGTTPAGRRFSTPPNGRNISMQRFIASKGKEVVSTFSGQFNGSKEKSLSALNLNGDSTYQELKPPKAPQVAKTTNGVTGKRSLTAENKIQEELKEMQAREDELRQQRARLLGLSQPNLTLLDDDEIQDGLLINQDDLNPKFETNGVLERASSNPNLLDDDFIVGDKKINKKNSSFGGPRRRSMLIAQWEQRIQSTEPTKS